MSLCANRLRARPQRSMCQSMRCVRRTTATAFVVIVTPCFAACGGELTVDVDGSADASVLDGALPDGRTVDAVGLDSETVDGASLSDSALDDGAPPNDATRDVADSGAAQDGAAVPTALRVFYVATDGDDDNDGLSWGAAVAHGAACVPRRGPARGPCRFRAGW